MCVVTRWKSTKDVCDHPAHSGWETRTYCGLQKCTARFSFQTWLPRDASRIVDLTCDNPKCPVNRDLLDLLVGHTNATIEAMENRKDAGARANAEMWMDLLACCREKLAAAGFIEPESSAAGDAQSSATAATTAVGGMHNPMFGQPSRVWQQKDFVFPPIPSYDNGRRPLIEYDDSDEAEFRGEDVDSYDFDDADFDFDESLPVEASAPAPSSSQPVATGARRGPGRPRTSNANPATPGVRRPHRGAFGAEGRKLLWDLRLNQGMSWDDIRNTDPVS